jgi:hypothetical protein
MHCTALTDQGRAPFGRSSCLHVTHRVAGPLDGASGHGSARQRPDRRNACVRPRPRRPWMHRSGTPAHAVAAAGASGDAPRGERAARTRPLAPHLPGVPLGRRPRGIRRADRLVDLALPRSVRAMRDLARGVRRAARGSPPRAAPAAQAQARSTADRARRTPQLAVRRRPRDLARGSASDPAALGAGESGRPPRLRVGYEPRAVRLPVRGDRHPRGHDDRGVPRPPRGERGREFARATADAFGSHPDRTTRCRRRGTTLRSSTTLR